MAVRYICFVGASTVEGLGDEDGVGWPGRLCAMPPAKGHPVVVYNLGIRGNTSAAIARRWRAETAERLPDGVDGTVVLSFGNNDTAETESGTLRMPLDETLMNVESVVSAAMEWKRTLWVGPTPVRPDLMPFRSAITGTTLNFRNERLAALNSTYGGIAAKHGVPYLDIFTPLSRDAGWNEALGSRDGLHPNGFGYGLIAQHVASWPAWLAIFT